MKWNIIFFLIFSAAVMSARADTTDLREIPGTQINLITVDKAMRLLTVFQNNRPLKSYRIALGFSPVGHKQQEGDGKTPEGVYKIIEKKENSDFHLALRINYPNAKDKKNAKLLGVDPGGNIMIHGLPNGKEWLGQWHSAANWTQGCVAISNTEIEEIFDLVKIGTKVVIFP